MAQYPRIRRVAKWSATLVCILSLAAWACSKFYSVSYATTHHMVSMPVGGIMYFQSRGKRPPGTTGWFCEPTMDVTMFFPDKPWTWRLAEGWGLRGLTFERTPGGNVPIYVIIPLCIPLSLSLVPAIILWRPRPNTSANSGGNR